MVKILKQYKKILNWKKFNEAISGTELIGNLGPGSPNVPIDNLNIIDIIYLDDIDSFYTYDDYIELYNNYLKSGGSASDITLASGFTKRNIKKLLNYIDGTDQRFM